MKTMKVDCMTCHGYGSLVAAAPGGYVKCPHCKNGKIELVNNELKIFCETCNGTGDYASGSMGTCGKCDGVGYETTTAWVVKE